MKFFVVLLSGARVEEFVAYRGGNGQVAFFESEYGANIFKERLKSDGWVRVRVASVEVDLAKTETIN